LAATVWQITRPLTLPSPRKRGEGIAQISPAWDQSRPIEGSVRPLTRPVPPATLSRKGRGFASGRAQRNKGSTVKRPSDPETEVEVPVDGGEPEAGRRAELPRIVDPGTAAEHTVFATPGGPCRTAGRRVVVVFVIAVLDPLPDVPMHLIEPPWVRSETVNRHGLFSILALRAAVVGYGPVIVRPARRDRRAPPERRRPPSPRDIFPFRFTQQAMGLPGQAGPPIRRNGLGPKTFDALYGSRLVPAIAQLFVVPQQMCGRGRQAKF